MKTRPLHKRGQRPSRVTFVGLAEGVGGGCNRPLRLTSEAARFLRFEAPEPRLTNPEVRDEEGNRTADSAVSSTPSQTALRIKTAFEPYIGLRLLGVVVSGGDLECAFEGGHLLTFRSDGLILHGSVAAAPPLRCAECGREADEGARGWRALHGRENPVDEPEAFVFCPACAEREFGTAGGRST